MSKVLHKGKWIGKQKAIEQKQAERLVDQLYRQLRIQV